MRRLLALLLIPALALAPAACRQQPEGTVKVVVIGGEPKMRDPALGPLGPADAVLLGNVAQGLVRFDAAGNIVGGLAERWNVSDDGLSYIFRLASTEWPDGKKVTAQQVAKLLKRNIAPRSRNPLKDTLGAVTDIVAMTDRVIEIRLAAPRPSLLTTLAQPEMGVVRGRLGTGPFRAAPDPQQSGRLRLTRQLASSDDAEAQKEELLLSGTDEAQAVQDFATGKSDLVLGGTFADLPVAQRAQLPRGSLRFDPASGLFGLMPVKKGGAFDSAEARRLLSQAIDRDALVQRFGVPGLAARATLLEPGLDGLPPSAPPAWFGTPIETRRPALVAEAQRLFEDSEERVIRVALPEGPGSDIVLSALARDWGAIGFTVERAASEREADFRLVDAVAPSSSAAWFVRRFRCGAAAVCEPDADTLMDAARQAPVPLQRYALLQQAAAKIDDAQLFIAIAAPIRWSLVGKRLEGFAGNRFAIHTLTDLEQRAGAGD
jgi:peptide/nickel transport system substrate-binding protein